jgi:hypothetical protein
MWEPWPFATIGASTACRISLPFFLRTELSPSWEAANCAAIQKIPSNFKQPKGSSQCSYPFFYLFLMQAYLIYKLLTLYSNITSIFQYLTHTNDPIQENTIIFDNMLIFSEGLPAPHPATFSSSSSTHKVRMWYEMQFHDNKGPTWHGLIHNI